MRLTEILEKKGFILNIFKEIKEKNMRKTTEKEYKKRRQYVTITFNEEEIATLKNLMKKEEWENRAGFIKSKIFGRNFIFEYSKIVQNLENINDISERLKEDIRIFNRHLDYAALKKIEYEDVLKSRAVENDKKLRASVNISMEWLKEIKEQEAILTEKVNELLNRLDIIVTRENPDPIRSLPQSIIDKHLSNWNDTTSPEFLEGVRRKEEKNKK